MQRRSFRSFDSSLILKRSTQAGVQKDDQSRGSALSGVRCADDINSAVRRIRSTVLSVLLSSLLEKDPEALGAVDCQWTSFI
jgi:hypothetical protein